MAIHITKEVKNENSLSSLTYTLPKSHSKKEPVVALSPESDISKTSLIKKDLLKTFVVALLLCTGLVVVYFRFPY